MRAVSLMGRQGGWSIPLRGGWTTQCTFLLTLPLIISATDLHVRSNLRDGGVDAWTDAPAAHADSNGAQKTGQQTERISAQAEEMLSRSRVSCCNYRWLQVAAGAGAACGAALSFLAHIRLISKKFAARIISKRVAWSTLTNSASHPVIGSDFCESSSCGGSSLWYVQYSITLLRMAELTYQCRRVWPKDCQ